MRVGIKSDGEVGMSECLLNHLGVGADREHHGDTGATQVVEADVGKPCTSAADSRICRKSNALSDSGGQTLSSSCSAAAYCRFRAIRPGGCLLKRTNVAEDL